MYEVVIYTPQGPVTTTMKDFTDIATVLAPYEKTYTGFSAKHIATKETNKMENIKVRITDFDINWKKIKSACMTTISKEAGDKEPSHEWKRKLLLCQHSPIRRGEVSWKWEEIPYAISTHFVRHHEGCEKFIGTSREDRTGVKREERSQMAPVPMEMDANIQALINISEKRLCTAADPTTRKYWAAVLEAIREYDEDIYWACVPQCVRCGGCPEYTNCGFYDNLMKDQPLEVQKTLAKRYDVYNQWRDKRCGR